VKLYYQKVKLLQPIIFRRKQWWERVSCKR